MNKERKSSRLRFTRSRDAAEPAETWEWEPQEAELIGELCRWAVDDANVQHRVTDGEVEQAVARSMEALERERLTRLEGVASAAIDVPPPVRRRSWEKWVPSLSNGLERMMLRLGLGGTLATASCLVILLTLSGFWLGTRATRGSDAAMQKESWIGDNSRPASPTSAAALAAAQNRTLAEGGDLLAIARRGESVNSNWKAKVVYFDFDLDHPVWMRAHDVLRIEYSLTGSDVLGIQIRPKGENPNDRGDMQVRRGVGGTDKVLELKVPSDREAVQIAFQLGENAWGQLGGSMQAELLLHAIYLRSKETTPSKPAE